MSCAVHKFKTRGCVACAGTVTEVVEAAPTPESYDDRTVSCRAICQECMQGFDYPSRRGRPPKYCPGCLQNFSDIKQAKRDRREKKKIQRAAREADPGTWRVTPEQDEAEQRSSFERFKERVKDLVSLPSWDEWKRS